MRTIPIFLILLALALSGCSRPIVQADSTPRIDYSEFRTYRWAPYFGDVSPEVDQRIMEDFIVASTDAELADKGYEWSRRGRPDFLVAYHVIASTTTDVDEVGISPARPMPRGILDIREEGTLILDIIDPDERTVIWRGWAIRGLSNVKDPDPEQVRMVVAGILANYPSN